MRYLSVCSGIEAATAAWHPLGWEPVAFSEVDLFPSAVLAQHYPDVPNLGDMTQIDGSKYNGFVDLLVGGTPCQSFSVAGLRGGMEDPRGNLALAFLGLVDTIRPRYFVWENVPGVLSSSGGRDFGSFVSAVAQLGYRGGWRVLDAQYFGLAQRRKRVFFVGCSSAAERSPREVLFDPESLRGNPPPSRGQGEDAAAGAGARAVRMRQGCPGGGKGPLVSEELSLTLASSNDQTLFTPVAYSIQERAVSEGRGGPKGKGFQEGCAYTLEARHRPQHVAVFVDSRQDPVVREGHTQPLGAKDNGGAVYYSHDYNQDRVYGTGGASEACTATRRSNFLVGHSVRRLTPVECERLQGFPDDYTRIAWRGKAPEDCPDGPRYKALGNSMAVPVMRWIGSRIGD